MRKHTVFIGLYSLLSHLSLTTTSFFIDLLRENLFVNSVFFVTFPLANVIFCSRYFSTPQLPLEDPNGSSKINFKINRKQDCGIVREEDHIREVRRKVERSGIEDGCETGGQEDHRGR